MDEQVLISSAKQGDLDAFNQLVLRYQNFLFGIALSMLRDEDAAADATQEAFINAFRKLNTFRDGSLRSWFARITINTCYDQMRRDYRHPATSLEYVNAEGMEFDESDWFLDPAPGPAEHFEKMELEEAIQHCLGTLPPAYRIMLVLVDVEGLSYEEAGSIANVPVGTVKSRLARARLQMRQALQTYCTLLPQAYHLDLVSSMQA